MHCACCGAAIGRVERDPYQPDRGWWGAHLVGWIPLAGIGPLVLAVLACPRQ